VKTYSHGMKQRLGIAQALLGKPDLLILDEPTTGLDPHQMREMRDLIRSIAERGATVLLSSHLLGEVEQVCSHVAVMSLGKLLAQGPIEELQAAGGTKLRVETDDTALAAEVLARLGLADLTVEGATVLARLDGHRPEDCNRELVMAGVGVRSLAAIHPTLEDTFLTLTGEGFDVVR